MDDDLESRIIGTLNQAVQWAEARQRKLLSEVLALQKKINNLHDTKPRLRKKQPKQLQASPPKQPDPSSEYTKKIDQMISKAQQQIQSLDSQSNPNSKKSKIPAATKTKLIEQLPQIQKKPPIPVVNRSKDPQIVVHKPNYHYRNKNQVTGKITDTPFMKSAGKISGTGVSTSTGAKKEEGIFQPSSLEKGNNGNQKLAKKESVTVVKAPMVKEPQPIKHAASLDSKDKKQPAQKTTYIDFQTFKIPLPTLLQASSQPTNPSHQSHRPKIQSLLAQHTKNELGYKQNESKALTNFISYSYKLAATRNKLPVKKGLCMMSRSRQPHLGTFNFQELLDWLQGLLDGGVVGEEYRMDGAVAVRIKCLYQMLVEVFQGDIRVARENLKLPPTLGIDFQMSTNPQQPSYCPQQPQSSPQSNPHLPNFYTLLQSQLHQLKTLQNFDKSALNKLRVLISIILYDGKRSPVLVQTQKHEEWKEYYQDQCMY